MNVAKNRVQSLEFGVRENSAELYFAKAQISDAIQKRQIIFRVMRTAIATYFSF